MSDDLRLSQQGKGPLQGIQTQAELNWASNRQYGHCIASLKNAPKDI
jgi:hypothetical protein